MTLTAEQWAQLQSLSFDECRPLMTRDEIRSHMQQHQQPQVLQSVTVESEIKIRDELGFKPRRKGNQPIVDEEWSIVVGDVRGLEDLVLECVDAGISLADYL